VREYGDQEPLAGNAGRGAREIGSMTAQLESAADRVEGARRRIPEFDHTRGI